MLSPSRQIGGEGDGIGARRAAVGELLDQALAQRGPLLDREVAGADGREQRARQVVEPVGELLDRRSRTLTRISVTNDMGTPFGIVQC